MNYKHIYDTLCERAKQRQTPNGYIEKHRIVPGCMGGIYDRENTVRLTAEEHFLAHQLLTKIYPNNRKLIFALRAMTFASKRHVRNNKEFGWIRRLANQARTGRKNTDETKRKMSEAAKRRWENTAYEDMGAVTNPKSTVTKQRMSEAAKERWRKTDSDTRKAHGDAIRKGHQLKLDRE